MKAEVYSDLHNYILLEDAFESAYMYLDSLPDNGDVWLANLHSLLVTEMYSPGENPAHDTVVLSAIDMALKRRKIKAGEADRKTNEIINYLTLT